MPTPDDRDLTTVAAVKAWLAIPSAETGDDDLLQSLITDESVGIADLLSRPIFEATFTETYDGTAGGRLLLRVSPVKRVVELRVGGVVIPEVRAADPGGSGFVLDGPRGVLALRGTRFPRAPLSVTVTYVGGWDADSIPEPIRRACLSLVAFRYRGRTRIGQVSQNLAGQVVTYQQRELPLDAARLLKRYQRVMPV